MMTHHIWKKTCVSGTALLLTLTLAACSAAPGTPAANDPFQLAKAEHPQMPSYPDEQEYTSSNGDIEDAYYDAYDAWWEARREQMNLPGESTESERSFYTKAIRQLLSDTQGDNRICSPLNLYLALGMLTELTDGSSRDQILSLLGSDGIETLRTRSGILWRSNYCDDGATSCILASSLWLDKDMKYTASTLNSLARNYYASSYQGEMGSDAFNQKLRDWLNEQTGGLLKEQAEGFRLEDETVLALASTIYFRSKWSHEFAKSQTKDGVFHAPSGDAPLSFMHQSGSREYYWGSHFSAVAQSLESYGDMWLLLPDEGVSPEELLQDEEAMSFLLTNGDWDNHKFLTVNLALPKFDISSDLDLVEELAALGVTDVLDPALSDFSPMTPEADGVFLSQAKHAVRVAIDEEGCTAAAYTVMAMAGAAEPPAEEIDFVVDRPFLFVITGPAGAPLFVGVVNQPA